MIESVFEEECCARVGAAGSGAPVPLPQAHPLHPPAPAVAQPCTAEPPAGQRPRRVLVVEFL